MYKNIRIILVVIATALMFSLVASAQGNTLVIAGDDHAYPPFAFLDKEGKPAGFNVDLIEAVANVLGWDLQIELGSWFAQRTLLAEGEIDLITGMFYSPERADQVEFTNRHSVASGDVFSRTDQKVRSLDDLYGKRIVVQKNDIVHDYLADLDWDLEFVEVETVAQALRLVASGEEDFAAVLLIPGHYAIEEYELSNVRSNNVQMGPFDYGFAVHKDNAALQVMLNEGLKIVQATGKYEEIYHRWLGVYEQRELIDWRRSTRIFVAVGIAAAVVFIWALILQYLVRQRTADLTRLNARLTRSRADLFDANEELRATIQQLTATSNELALQYEQLQNVEAALAEEKDLLRTTLLSVGDGIIVTDRLGEVIMINQAAQKLTGWTEQYAVGRFFRDLVPGEHATVVEQVLYTESIIEVDELSLNLAGRDIIVACTIAPILDQSGVVRGAVAVLRDISEAVRQRKEIEYLSFHDPLTGLYNRRGMARELEFYDQESCLPLAVIVVDVNGLKLINDSYGHAWGDELLTKVANILKQVASDSGFAARMGGDEFALILPKADETTATKAVNKLRKLAAQETVKSIQVSVALGLEIKYQADENVQSCFNRAEERMYADKALSSPYHPSVARIVTSLFQKSSREKEHSYRVAALAKSTGLALGLNERQANELYTIGLLHDVGDDPQEMERDPEFGYLILRGAQEVENAARTMLAYQEYFARQDEVAVSGGPLYAQIISIAHTFDALTRKSAHRRALSEAEALEEIQKQAGTQFDPELVQVFREQVVPHLTKQEGTDSVDEGEHHLDE